MISSQSTPEQFVNRVAMKIRLQRESAGVSQKEAAQKLNIGHRTYQRIESAEVPCDILFLQRFSLAFDMDFLELVTPYAPRPLNFNLYINDPKPFEKHPFVIQSKFLDLSQKFERDQFSFAKNTKFLEFDHNLILWSQSKRFYNNYFREFFKVTKSTPPVLLPRPEEKINFFDCLFYHRPKYTVKNYYDYNVHGERLNIEIFSSHVYHENEVLGFSLIKAQPYL